MLKIRLSRGGKKNSPFFRVVLTDHTRAAKHGYKKVLGHYNPLTKDFKINNIDDIKEYVSHGVQLSPTVTRLLQRNDITV